MNIERGVDEYASQGIFEIMALAMRRTLVRFFQPNSQKVGVITTRKCQYPQHLSIIFMNIPCLYCEQQPQG